MRSIQQLFVLTKYVFCVEFWQMLKGLFIYFYFLWPTPASFLFIFVLFKHKFYRKNCRRQRDSNSDRLSRRRAR